MAPIALLAAPLCCALLGAHGRTCVQRRLHDPSMSSKKPRGLPPIASRHFTPLDGPANITALLTSAGEDTVSVVKYQAPWCRTCRALAPRLDKALDRVARRWPDSSPAAARLYSLELVRNGRAAGERMNKYFKSRNATELPYIEVYRGDQLIDAAVIPPTNLERFQQMVGAVQARHHTRWYTGILLCADSVTARYSRRRG